MILAKKGWNHYKNPVIPKPSAGINSWAQGLVRPTVTCYVGAYMDDDMDTTWDIY